MSLHWHTEPLLLVSILGALWLYILATGPLRKYLAPPRAPFEPLRATAYLFGIIWVYLAVGSPLDALGEQFLMSAHMVQHMILIYLCPPLLYLGIPGWLADRLLSWKPMRSAWQLLTKPIVAGFLFTATYTLWHVPAAYEAALRSKPIHILEHATMFGTAMLMWWPLMARGTLSQPLSYPARIVYVFLLMVAQIPVFAWLSFTPYPLYPTYEFAPRIFLDTLPLDPISDQRIGGVLMKVINMPITLGIAGYCFYRMYEKDQAQTLAARIHSATQPS